MTDAITILTTGGTIDKVYFDANSQFEVGASVVSEILREARVACAVEIRELMRKDSLDLTDADREVIAGAVADAGTERVVITHGTDTMTRTAECLRTVQESTGKTIVLTGSIAPARFALTDAIFNVGLAFGAVQSQPPGVYIAMSGQVFEAGRVRKNVSAGRFEPVMDTEGMERGVSLTINLDAHWMPFTANRAFKAQPRMIVGAEGHYFESDDGRQIYDSLSGLWCCGLGHNIRPINQAITEQLERLDYAPSFQFGHPASFELAERLGDFMPVGLNRVFFTNSGSESADTSLKIARAYWRAVGQPGKTKLIGRLRGYHGVNFGGMSVGGIGANRKVFGQGVDADHLSATLLPENRFSQGLPQYGEHLADELYDLIQLHDASNIAAVLVEPMSGSGGVVVPPQGYLERLRELCTEFGILLIFDEVITGLGRCGAKTGAESFGVAPDILNIAKQLTNGLLPMGAVVVRQDIHDAFMQQALPDHGIELPHGYTYSAHPVAAAAALATLDYLEAQEIFAASRDLAPVFGELLHGLKGAAHVVDIRNYGLAGAIQLDNIEGDPTLRPYRAGIALWQAGFYVRWGGDTLQFGPPFTSTRDELDRLFNAVGDTLNALD